MLTDLRLPKLQYSLRAFLKERQARKDRRLECRVDPTRYRDLFPPDWRQVPRTERGIRCLERWNFRLLPRRGRGFLLARSWRCRDQEGRRSFRWRSPWTSDSYERERTRWRTRWSCWTVGTRWTRRSSRRKGRSRSTTEPHWRSRRRTTRVQGLEQGATDTRRECQHWIRLAATRGNRVLPFVETPPRSRHRRSRNSVCTFAMLCALYPN